RSAAPGGEACLSRRRAEGSAFPPRFGVRSARRPSAGLVRVKGPPLGGGTQNPGRPGEREKNHEGRLRNLRVEAGREGTETPLGPSGSRLRQLGRIRERAPRRAAPHRTPPDPHPEWRREGTHGVKLVRRALAIPTGARPELLTEETSMTQTKTVSR